MTEISLLHDLLTSIMIFVVLVANFWLMTFSSCLLLFKILGWKSYCMIWARVYLYCFGHNISPARSLDFLLLSTKVPRWNIVIILHICCSSRFLGYVYRSSDHYLDFCLLSLRIFSFCFIENNKNMYIRISPTYF